MDSKICIKKISNSWNKFASTLNDFGLSPLNKSKNVKRNTYLIDSKNEQLSKRFFSIDSSSKGINNKTISLEHKTKVINHCEVPISLIKQLYSAKCQDLLRFTNLEQEAMFVKNFQTFCCNRTLSLQNMNLSIASSKVISKILLSSICLARINLSKNQLGNKGCLQIVTSVKHNPSIIDINLSNNNITIEGAEDIIFHLISDSLISINLSTEENLNKNTLGPCNKIEKLIMSNTLSYLNLSGNGITIPGFQKIISPLAHNKALIYLNFSNNCAIKHAIKEFINAILLINLEECLLSSCKLKDKSCQSFSNLLITSKTLRKLDISDNLLTGEGIKLILTALASNQNLISLNLSKNNLSKGMPDNFSDIFIDNHTLEELYLSNCNLTNILHQFIEVLNRTVSLKKLDLSFNHIQSKGIELLCLGLSLNKTLKSLNLSFNHIKNKGGIALAHILQDNPYIEELNLKENNIKNKAAKILINACRYNTSLIKLNLEMNPINIRYTFSINQILEKHKNCIPNKQISDIKKQVNQLIKDTEKCDVIYSKLEESKYEHKQHLERIDKQNKKYQQIKDLEGNYLNQIKQERNVYQKDLAIKNEKYNNICNKINVTGYLECFK